MSECLIFRGTPRQRLVGLRRFGDRNVREEENWEWMISCVASRAHLDVLFPLLE